MNPSTIRSRIAGNCSLLPLKVPAFRIISTLQDEENTAAQVEALYLCTALISQSLGLDPHEMIARARRQIADADAVRNPHLEAIRDYAVGELKL